MPVYILSPPLVTLLLYIRQLFRLTNLSVYKSPHSQLHTILYMHFLNHPHLLLYIPALSLPYLVPPLLLSRIRGLSRENSPEIKDQNLRVSSEPRSARETFSRFSANVVS